MDCEWHWVQHYMERKCVCVCCTCRNYRFAVGWNWRRHSMDWTQQLELPQNSRFEMGVWVECELRIHTVDCTNIHLQVLIQPSNPNRWNRTAMLIENNPLEDIHNFSTTKKQLSSIPFFSSTSSNQYPYITESHQSWWKPQNRTKQKTTHPHKLYQQVMLLGDSGVGKTCLLVRFRDGTFLSGNFISTVGIDFRVSDNASKIEWNARLCLCCV